ncbi:Hypothetical protein FKW44_006196, partial [Caligus rogercresseyi]
FSEEAEENESTTEGLIKEEVTKADKGISKVLMALKSEMAEAFGNILYDNTSKVLQSPEGGRSEQHIRRREQSRSSEEG